MKSETKPLMAALLALALAGCAHADMGGHVANDPGGASIGGAPGGTGGGSGAVPSDMETHASGALNGSAAANGDPITGTGNLGSGSTIGDPMSGSNQIGPAARF